MVTLIQNVIEKAGSETPLEDLEIFTKFEYNIVPGIRLNDLSYDTVAKYKIDDGFSL